MNKHGLSFVAVASACPYVTDAWLVIFGVQQSITRLVWGAFTLATMAVALCAHSGAAELALLCLEANNDLHLINEYCIGTLSV